MTIATTGALIDRARAAGGAVGAFNVITLEHAEAIVAAAERVGQPVILQISQNAVRYHHGALVPLTSACVALAEPVSARVALHLDHVEDEDLLHRAADCGFSSVMFDAGALPYAQNVASTARAAEWAHGAGLWIEAELGYIGGKPDAPLGAHAAGVRTDPVEAADFVSATGVDALAVAVGSSHAMTERTAAIDVDLVARLRTAVPVPLVLHGSSGVPEDELVRAIEAGLTKINFGTALNNALTAAVRDVLADTAVVDPRTYLAQGREAMTAAVVALITTIDSAVAVEV